MTTIYELNEKYQRLLDVSECVDPEAFEDALEDIKDELDTKIGNYARIVNQLKLDEEQLSSEIRRLNKKKQAITNNINRLRNVMKDSMLQTNTTRLVTPLFSLSIRTNKKPLVIDLNKLPDQYIKITKAADKNKIRKSLDDGNKIEGVYLGDSDYSLTIR